MKKATLSLLVILMLLSCRQTNNAPEVLNVASGKIERIENFESQFVKPRNIDVWLPDGYSSDNKYAVLYMHDGQMLFDSTTTWNKQEWGVDETLGGLMKEDQIRSTILIGIWNTEFRHSEYFPQKPFESLDKTFRDSLLLFGKRYGESALFKTEVCSDNYLKFIVEELKPFIDNKYATHSDVKNTFVAGSSMGGLISMYALCEYPEVFCGAACLSTHWVGIHDTADNPIPLKFAEYLDSNLPSPENHLLYFDFGTETLDALYQPSQTLVDSIMVKHGYSNTNWKTFKFEGENHSEIAWSKRLDIPMKFLLAR